MLIDPLYCILSETSETRLGRWGNWGSRDSGIRGFRCPPWLDRRPRSIEEPLEEAWAYDSDSPISDGTLAHRERPISLLTAGRGTLDPFTPHHDFSFRLLDWLVVLRTSGAAAASSIALLHYRCSEDLRQGEATVPETHTLCEDQSAASRRRF